MSDISSYQSMASIQGTNSLEAKVKHAPNHDKLVKAAKEFESVFMDIVTKSMRDSVEKSDVFGDSQKSDFFQGMLDTEYSKLSTARKNTGLAEAIVRQMEPTLPTEKMVLKPMVVRPAADMKTSGESK